MNKLFPSMLSKPEPRTFFGLIPCWAFFIVLIPMFMPFIGLGLWEKWEQSVWLEIGYHVLGGIVMLAVIFSYLKDEWYMVSTKPSYYLKHVALTVGLMLGTEVVLLGTLFLYGFNIGYMLQGLPVVEMFVSHTPWYLVSLQPVFGTLTLSIFASISCCALFYCFAFAPVSYLRPWLGYLAVAGATLIPPLVNILWRGEAAFVLSVYLAHLPIHLLACWSYQKTDNVWTPLLSLMGANALMSLPLIFLFR